ncbi:hypothetical protein [Pelagicoccus sp. SDUM812005]|uniref:hypothetical protein n=1 Tax=Pelagicoccus sp. SDUM812005 TaxID=3041257 RepID=UPI0028103D73|nr:hypothetical protein [Pelagicoccus sp. SDUM812005]MDQ8179963.1 hypothetical protein [Pelagicoccus sp. SDUM812005]
MSKLKTLHSNASLRFTKICLSCIGIAGTAVLCSGILKMGVLNNDRKLDHAFRLLRPLSDSLTQIAERALY